MYPGAHKRYNKRMDKYVEEKLDAFFSKYPIGSFAKGELILRADQPVTKIYYLKEGFVRQYLITPNGEEITLTVFKPVSYFPIMLVLNNKRNKYYFEAIEKITVRACPPNDILAFLKKNPDVLFDLTCRFADGLNGMLLKIENMVFESAYAKVASLLLYLANRFGEKQDTAIVINLPLTHHDIGSWVGLQRETVSRQIESLIKKGVLTNKNHTLVVENLEKLKEEVNLFHPD